jgi:hypothetical protein
MCPICNKEKGCSHILRCKEMRSWRGELVNKRLKSIKPETGTTIVTNKNNKLQKFSSVK